MSFVVCAIIQPCWWHRPTMEMELKPIPYRIRTEDNLVALVEFSLGGRGEPINTYLRQLAAAEATARMEYVTEHVEDD